MTDLFHPNGWHQNRGQVLRDGYPIDTLEEHVELDPFAALQGRTRQLMEYQ